jgi:hypothetical protein
MQPLLRIQEIEKSAMDYKTISEISDIEETWVGLLPEYRLSDEHITVGIHFYHVYSF